MSSLDSPPIDETEDQPVHCFCAGVLMGLCLMFPFGSSHAALPEVADLSTVHRAAQPLVRDWRAKAAESASPACGAVCVTPLSGARLAGRDADIQLGGSSAFDLINDRRELRYKWRGSPDGVREHSLKLRASRNRTTLTWEGRF